MRQLSSFSWAAGPDMSEVYCIFRFIDLPPTLSHTHTQGGADRQLKLDSTLCTTYSIVYRYVYTISFSEFVERWGKRVQASSGRSGGEKVWQGSCGVRGGGLLLSASHCGLSGPAVWWRGISQVGGTRGYSYTHRDLCLTLLST